LGDGLLHAGDILQAKQRTTELRFTCLKDVYSDLMRPKELLFKKKPARRLFSASGARMLTNIDQK
jgi:hypothetical protein